MAATTIPSSVVIAGGGIIGSGTAYELAKRGMPVTLIERGRIGGEASWASAGIISLPHRPWQLPQRVELDCAREGPATALLVAEALATGKIPDLLTAFAPTGQPVTA